MSLPGLTFNNRSIYQLRNLQSLAGGHTEIWNLTGKMNEIWTISNPCWPLPDEMPFKGKFLDFTPSSDEV